MSYDIEMTDVVELPFYFTNIGGETEDEIVFQICSGKFSGLIIKIDHVHIQESPDEVDFATLNFDYHIISSQKQEHDDELSIEIAKFLTYVLVNLEKSLHE